MTYRGRVEGGVVVLEGDVVLPDGTPVNVEPVASPRRAQEPIERQPAEPAAESPQDDAIYRICDLAVDTGIPDLSVNIDHYLYGHPKVRDADK